MSALVRIESAEINRHRVGEERALNERGSCSLAARNHVKQLTGINTGRPLCSEITHPGDDHVVRMENIGGSG